MGDKGDAAARGVNTHPAVAQRRSLRNTKQDISIQEKASKLKAQKNELTGTNQFTVFNS